eukprot:TRINITY_DN124728_c0_g2_i1.p4 TRINITY_DN124728_c0_g2~~TRINITY_DN124728_c0_g2_i1.p4  ORF type:complete len:108 (+),score=26.54 TRINITY_DN124728_c0_g2_i1:100-423(+)
MTEQRQSSRIADKQRLDLETVEANNDAPQIKKKKRAKTNYENVKSCIQRMKDNDPVKYEEYKEKSRTNSKTHRNNLSEEQKAKSREAATLPVPIRMKSRLLTGTMSK